MIGQAKTSLSSPHQKGTMLILQKRLTSGLERSCRITQGTSLRLLLDGLGQTTPDLPLFSPHLGAPSPTILNSMFTLASLLYRVVGLRRTMPTASACLETRTTHINALRSLHKDLLDWQFSALGGDQWRPIVSIITLSGRDEGSPRAISTFPSLNAILIWTSFWTIRLEVLLCLDRLQPTLRVQLDMSALTNSICSAVYQSTAQATDGYIGNDASGGIIMASTCIQRCLRMALQVPTLTKRRRAWIERQADFIAKSKGIGPT